MGSLFSKPKLPAVKPPTRMPIPGDDAEAKRRKALELQMQQGRASTELSENEESGRTALGK